MQKKTFLLQANVWHLREKPKRNEFTYSVYYLAHKLRLAEYKKPQLLSFDHFNVLSLYTKDLGKKDGTAWLPWIQEEFKKAGVPMLETDDVEVISHPRLFGYAFNPISFWILLDRDEAIKAVLCEVHNTFGQAHHYVLAHQDGKRIAPTDTFTAQKSLYVSPFNTMEGHYTFSFQRDREIFKSHIFYYVGEECVVKTAMSGSYAPLTSLSILGVVVKYPLMTVMVVVRIHLQAVRLYFKKVALTLSVRPRKHQEDTTQGKISSKNLDNKQQ